MMMNADEHRKLVEIEHALTRADPRLAAMLAAGIDSGTRLARQVANGFIAVVVALICGGLLLGDGSMIVGGCLVLMMMPPTVCLIAAANRRDQ
jgi:hypothetical protein